MSDKKVQKAVTKHQFNRLCDMIKIGEVDKQTLETFLNGQCLGNKFFKCLSSGELSIDSIAYSETLAEVKNDLYVYGVDGYDNFNDFDLNFNDINDKGLVTEEVEVEVYETKWSGNVVELFTSFCSDIEKLCFTQAQINCFVRKYSDWLDFYDGDTFFLLKTLGEFFVVRISIITKSREHGDERMVSLTRFGTIDSVKNSKSRFIIPKLG